ncbi:unnamed protein product, partial [Effrenium voratum]
KSLNVAIATVNTRVRASRKRPAQVPVAYPVLKPSNWHSLSNRMLFTVIASPYTYRTLDDLLEALVQDLKMLHTTGVTEWWDVKVQLKELSPDQ